MQSIKYQELSKIYLMQTYLISKSYDKLKKHIISSFFDFTKFESEPINLIIDCIKNYKISNDSLDKIFLAIAEYYLYNMNNDCAKKWIDISISINPNFAHCYINRSYFENKETKKYHFYINKAKSLNKYINNPLIYKNGYSPNIYIHQTAILSTINMSFDNL